VSQLVAYGDPQPARVAGRKYLSEKSVVEYDCSARQVRTIAADQHEGDRASGNIVYREANGAAKWMPVTNGTNMEVAWKRACDKQ
jgi:hypothetical protein